MILTNGSVMFNLSVLSNAPLCALPIKQNKKNPSGKINHCKWQRVQSDAPIARSLFFILHIYNPSFAELFNNVSHVFLFFFTCLHCLQHIHIFIHSYIPWRFTDKNHRNNLLPIVLSLNEWLFAHRAVCLRRSKPLYVATGFISKGDSSADSRLINTFMKSWSYRGGGKIKNKTRFCDKMKCLDIKNSVIKRQTHTAV